MKLIILFCITLIIIFTLLDNKKKYKKLKDLNKFLKDNSLTGNYYIEKLPNKTIIYKIEYINNGVKKWRIATLKEAKKLILLKYIKHK